MDEEEYTLNISTEDADLMKLWIDEDPYDLGNFTFDNDFKIKKEIGDHDED